VSRDGRRRIGVFSVIILYLNDAASGLVRACG